MDLEEQILASETSVWIWDLSIVLTYLDYTYVNEVYAASYVKVRFPDVQQAL